MAGKVNVDIERCKGCGLCIEVCPQNNLTISKRSNKVGHFPAEFTNNGCTGCALCALVCPDVAIEVLKEAREPAQRSGTK